MSCRLMAACLAFAVAAVGCAGSGVAQRQAEAVDDGVQATGRIDGRRVAISDGSPETNLDDCDPGASPDRDVCWIARTIDGVVIAFVVENPDALVPGERLPVRDHDCDTCDDVTDQVVVDLRIDGEQRRATGGRVVTREAGDRYAASFRIGFPDGDELIGEFNIRAFGPGER